MKISKEIVVDILGAVQFCQTEHGEAVYYCFRKYNLHLMHCVGDDKWYWAHPCDESYLFPHNSGRQLETVADILQEIHGDGKENGRENLQEDFKKLLGIY